MIVKMQTLVDYIVAHSPCRDKEALARLNHYVWITFIMIPLSLATAFYNLYIQHFILSISLILFCIYLIGSLFIIPNTPKVYQIYYTAVIFFSTLFLYLVYQSDEDYSLILWLFTYPVGIIFLLGNRMGFILSISLLAMSALLFLTMEHINDTYTLAFSVRFFITYIVVTSIVSWIEYYRARYQAETLRTQAALLLEQANLKKEIQRRTILEKELQRLAQTDPMTSLFNRRHFLKLAQKEITRAIRYHYTLCFAVLDVDYFKRINDTLGHPVGDIVVKTLANYLQKSLRENDIVARIGGEEFAFLLLHVNEEQARVKMEKVREEISQIVVNYSDSKELRLTVSIGLAMLSEVTNTLDSLYMKADQKLYEAKKAGRNCVR